MGLLLAGSASLEETNGDCVGSKAALRALALELRDLVEKSGQVLEQPSLALAPVVRWTPPPDEGSCFSVGGNVAVLEFCWSKEPRRKCDCGMDGCPNDGSLLGPGDA